MAEDKTIVFKLELDTKELKKNAEIAEQNLVDLVKKQKNLRDEQKQNTVEYVQLTEEIRINQKALKDNAQALQIQENLSKKTELSNKDLMLMQKALSVEYNNLTKNQRENTKEGQEIARKYKEVNDALNENSLAVGDGRRNVGLYKKAILEANKEISSLKKEVNQIGFAYGQTAKKIEENNTQMQAVADTSGVASAEYKALEKETAVLNETLVFQEQALKGANEELANQEKALESTKEEARKIGYVFGEQQKTIKDYRAELRDLQTTMLNMDANSDEYIEASKRAGELKDKIKEVAETTKGMTGGTGFEKMSNTMGLLKDDLMNLDFEGVSEKAKSLQQISQNMTFKEAIGGLKNMGSSLVSLGKTILANPMFLIVGAITAIGYAIYKFMDDTAELEAEHEKLNKTIERQNALMQIQQDVYLQRGQNALALLQSQNAGEEKLHNQRVANIIDEEMVRQDQMANEQRQLAERQAMYKKFLDEGENELAKKVKSEIEANKLKIVQLRSQEGQYKVDLQIEDNNFSQWKKEQREKEIEENKQNNQEAIESYKARLEKQKEAQEKAKNDRLALEKESIKQLRDLYLENAELTTQRELDLLENKYKTLELLAKGNLETLLQLQEEKNEELLKLNYKQKEEEKQALSNAYADELESLDNKLKELEQMKKIASKDEIVNIKKVEKSILEEKKLLKENEQVELLAIEDKYNQLSLEATQKTEQLRSEITEEIATNKVAQMEGELQREINALQKAGLSEQEIFELTKNKIIDIETEKNNIIQKNEELSIEERFKSQQEFEQKIIQLNQQSADEQVAIEQDKLDKIYTASAFAISQMQALANAYFESAQQNINQEIESSQRMNDEISNDLKERLDAGLISEEKYAIEKQKIDDKTQAEQKKLQLKAFKIQQNSQLANAILGGASAVVQALSSSPPPYSYILAAISASLAAVQIANIKNQSPPAFAGGGLTGQLITNNDGMPISRANGDNILATVRTGEIITNEKQQKYIEGVAGKDIWARAGVRGFASGGFTGGAITNRIDQQNETSRIVAEAMRNMPNPVVLVQDINDGQRNLAKVEDSVNF